MIFCSMTINEKMFLVKVMNYNTKLVYLREKNNLSQNDVANILKIARVTYNHFETQYDIIPLKHLNTLSNYFDVSIDYLLDLTNKVKYKNYRSNLSLELFSTRLREFRKENKLTQVDLAEVINTTHSGIAGYENKRCFMPTYFLYTICKKYHISADYLLGKIDSPRYLKN